MRFAFGIGPGIDRRIDPIRIITCAAFCLALTLTAFPADVHAQAAPSHAATLADLAGVIAQSEPAAVTAASDDATSATSEPDALASNTSDEPINAASMNGIALDDQVLSRQRGGALGMVMVAATPDLVRGNGNRVTLWDEIAPPAPLPVPVDAARAAQSNAVTYQRR
jgi:hypothetical protein